MAGTELEGILRHLAAHDVELIVVGMLSGVLQGTPLTTADIDIVHRRSKENVERADSRRSVEVETARTHPHRD
jgi:hypothetical protein